MFIVLISHNSYLTLKYNKNLFIITIIIKLKAALEILKWNQEETQFVTIGKVFFTPITDYSINRKAKTLKFLTANALLVTLGKPNENYRPDLVNTSEAQRDLMFPRDNTGITDAVLLLIKEKCGRYVLCKVILNKHF